MEKFIQKISSLIYDSIYRNQFSIPQDTILFHNNIQIKDEHEESKIMNGPITYNMMGNFVLFYLKQKSQFGIQSYFIEFTLEDYIEENNTIILNIVCIHND